MTSGAIQWGVPMKVLRLVIVDVSCAATPKSASLTWVRGGLGGAAAGCALASKRGWVRLPQRPLRLRVCEAAGTPHLAALCEQDVAALDVAVHLAEAMQIGQALGEGKGWGRGAVRHVRRKHAAPECSAAALPAWQERKKRLSSHVLQLPAAPHLECLCADGGNHLLGQPAAVHLGAQMRAAQAGGPLKEPARRGSKRAGAERAAVRRSGRKRFAGTCGDPGCGAHRDEVADAAAAAVLHDDPQRLRPPVAAQVPHLRGSGGGGIIG